MIETDEKDVPFPNFHMDDDGIVTRLVPWMMFDYDVEGMIPQRDNSDFFAQRRIELLKLLEQFITDPAGAIAALQAK